MSHQQLVLTGSKVQDLPAEFGVEVFVPGDTIPHLQAEGQSTEGLIDAAAGQGAAKWEVLDRDETPILFRGYGKWADKFLLDGWSVEAVVGRPLMPDTKGKGSRVDHVAGFEATWLLATPPSSGATSAS